MLSRFTSIIGDQGINITDMSNSSKGEYAYSLLDLETPVTEEALRKLEQVPGVFRVRVIK